MAAKKDFVKGIPLLLLGKKSLRTEDYPSVSERRKVQREIKKQGEVIEEMLRVLEDSPIPEEFIHSVFHQNPRGFIFRDGGLQFDTEGIYSEELPKQATNLLFSFWSEYLFEQKNELISNHPNNIWVERGWAEAGLDFEKALRDLLPAVVVDYFKQHNIVR